MTLLAFGDSGLVFFDYDFSYLSIMAATISLFVGIFLVFVIEFIKNAKSRLKENEEGLSAA